MLLSCASYLHWFDANVREHGFTDRYENVGVTVYGKTVGVVGIGMIGSRLLDVLEPFEVDVFEDEPNISGNPLLERDDCLVTPHVSGLLLETTTRQENMVSDAILRRARCDVPNNLVNPGIYDHSVAESLLSPSYR